MKVSVKAAYAMGIAMAACGVVQHQHALDVADPQLHFDQADVSTQPISAKHYPVYRFSVVQGGVHRWIEFKDIQAKDDVVREHYEGLYFVERTHLNADAKLYASYRRAGKVYWTAEPINVPKGEPVIWTNDEWIRERCGNRLSKVAHQPTEQHQPTEAELNTVEGETPAKDIPELVAPEVQHPDIALLTAPSESPLFTIPPVLRTSPAVDLGPTEVAGLPSGIGPGAIGAGGVAGLAGLAGLNSSSTPVAAVPIKAAAIDTPEPQTVGMTMAGLFALLALAMPWRKAK